MAMAMTIDIEPISGLKRAAALLDRLRAQRTPIVITQNGKAAAVLLDVESYEEQKRAFALLKMCLDGERAIDAGRVSSLLEFKQRLAAKKLSSKKRRNDNK